jgi:hypothetical protein
VNRPSSDAAILAQLIGLHYYHEPITLDATWGRGAIWRGCAYQPTTRFDQRPMPDVDVVGEWDQLPRLFEPASFQLVVWDPPHQTDGGERAFSKGTWSNAYGTALIRGHDNISHLYPTFLASARHVLTTNGMLLAKIADQVHAGEQQLQAVDLVLAARTAGWTVCEMVPKMRQPTPNDPRWRRQLHIRKAWSYWICAHPGPCTAVGVALVRTCEGCGRDFRARRSDARSCGGACRERLRYRRNLTDSRGAAQKLSVRTPAP